MTFDYHIDLFSGIGGFALGMKQAGFKFKHHYYSEIDKYAIQVYRKHFPEAEYVGSVESIDTDRIKRGRGIVTFGFPCQDISIAGKQGGLSASRSGLFFKAIEIITAMQPDYFIFENVKGLFSSEEGRDFETILRTITDIGYNGQWQCVNTRWVLPQNRERIYFIGTRKDLQFKSIFPILLDKYIAELQYEKVYEVSGEVSKIIKVFFERQKVQRESDEVVQVLFQQISESIQQGTTKKIDRETEEIRQFGKENISKTEAIFSRASGNDKSGGFFNVVQIPTEDMLLLWLRGSQSAYRFRFIQSEDSTFDDRSNGFHERIRNGEYGSLLLAVQFYKGKLFYSIGDGRNWAKIYIQEVGRCRQTLSDILEEQVDQKYFLSEKAIPSIQRKQYSKPKILQEL